MNRKTIPLFLILLMSGLGACTEKPDPHPVRAVAGLDLPRYMGHWFELGKYPNRFQTQCAADTTAEYSPLPDGAVRVVNMCRHKDGTVDQVTGRAEKDSADSDAKLRVRFAPRWLGWLPMVWGDYWVIEIDPDYSLAAVSDPRRHYLWILSRTPSVDPSRYQRMLDRVREQGFDTDRIEPTAQTGDAEK